MISARLSLLLVAASVFATIASPAEIQKRQSYSGQATWFEVGLGACGYTDTDSDPVIALSTDRYSGGANCNRQIQITNTDNGNVVFGQVRDECPGCGENDLDLSPSLFQQLGSLDRGVLPITWSLT